MTTKLRGAKDRETRQRDLQSWLTDRTDLAPVIAIRAALRVVPLACNPVSYEGDWKDLLPACFSATFVVWTAQRYEQYTQTAANAYAASRTSRFFMSVFEDSYTADAYAASRVAHAAAGAARAARAAVDPPVFAAEAAVSAAAAVGTFTSAGEAALWNSIYADVNWIEGKNSDTCSSHAPELLATQLWINETRSSSKKPLANAPLWARRPWNVFKKSDVANRAGFEIWIRWYEAVLAGQKEGYFDTGLTGDAERNVIALISRQDNAFWQRDAVIVNAEIKSWIEDAKERLQDVPASPLRVDSVDLRDEQPILVQRLSSHRFDRRDGRIEATPITEPPFDPILADTFVSELRTKLAEALDSLTGNNADEIVRRAIMRLSDLLRVSSSEMAEGILLMRANTLAAYNRAYSDPSSERERAIRAVLDDVSSSVDDLVQCFPGIRQISANRLALDMQTDRANEVEAVIQEVAELARKNAGVGPSTPAALDTGRDEVEDVSEKLASETSLERIADYIATRGDIVASRLLNATNFISATLQGAGRELAGISSDTWKEIRKTLPKATARGVSKGTEKAVEILVEKGTNFAIVGLAYVVAGPLGALAVLVPRLRGHAKKAEEIKDEVKKALGHEQ